MATRISFSNEKIRSVIKNITVSRVINRADQKVFMSALLSKATLSAEDQKMINQVYRGLQNGLIKVVD